MKTSTKFIVAAVVLFVIPNPITWFFGFMCAIAAIGLIIYQEISSLKAKSKTK